MPILAFDMNSANHQFRRYEFRGEHNNDYYDGDFEPLNGLEVDMRIEKSLAGEYGIYNLVSRSGLAFRRSWTHIRNDKTNMTVFWFVRRGVMTLSQPGGRHTVSQQQCTITRSSKAFYMELAPDESGTLEVMHVVAPSHKVVSFINDGVEAGRPFPTSSGDLQLAERIFELLFEDDGHIDQDIAEKLVQTLLMGVGKSIARISGDPAPRSTIVDKRISDVRRYINQNFSNPDLSARMIADSCGISLRYLCHILKKKDLSFSNLVWEQRLNTARDWLKDDNMKHYSISEIAYLAGFKSSSHFSRMFKLHHGVPPRAFRNQPDEETVEA